MEKGRCPICGKQNDCSAVAGKDPLSCWCMVEKIESGFFRVIPGISESGSCICRECNALLRDKGKIKKAYDLHIHTSASDGTDSPTEVVRTAVKKGLLGISITDHDTVAGIQEAVEAARETSLELIPGIELSATYNGRDVHILGYFLDIQDKDFLEELESIKKSRDARNDRILEKLKKYRIKITEEELEEEAKGDIKSKLHFANLLVKKGYAYNKKEAFANYLGPTGVAYEERSEFTPEKAIRILKNNGALAFLAHPGLYSHSLSEIKNLVLELKKIGLDGIEAEYPNFTKEEKKKFRELAMENNLMISGGSDYHGENREENQIGQEGITFYQMNILKEFQRSEKK